MKAKKLLFGLLSILCFGFSTFALASCGEQPTETPTEQPTQQPTNEPHVHEWNEGEIVDNATCTEAGLIAFKCKTCEETKLDVISALGHTEVVDEAVEPTCTETGLTEGKHCSECRKVFIYQQCIPAKGHTEVVRYDAIKATCTETGLTEEKYCSVCNVILSKQNIIPYIDHSYINGECNNCGCTDGLEFSKKYIVGGYNGYEVTGIGTAQNENIVIPSIYNGEPVTSIGETAFWNCSSLTSVIIPNTVTSIKRGAFWNCSSLTSITIPKSVTSIDSEAFSGCSLLTKIIVDNNNKEFSAKDGVLYNKDKTKLITYPEGKSNTSFVIPDGVTRIGSLAFEGCSSLVNITIPDSVISIDGSAFIFCSSLTKIIVDNNNKEFCFEDGVLYNKDKTKLISYIAEKSNTSFVIPDNVTSIAPYAFASWVELESIVIPNSVTSIGDTAFLYCSSLESIIIPNSVTSIGYQAFWGCSSLESIIIPNSVTSIFWGAFTGCSSLKTVYYSGTKEQWDSLGAYIENATIIYNYKG